MKRYAAIAVLTLLVLSMLTGCFSSGGDTTEDAAPTPEMTEGDASSSENTGIQLDSRYMNVEAFDADIKNNSMAISKDGMNAIVCNSESSSVIVYDLASSSILKKYDYFVTPRHIAYSNDGSSFYVSDSSLGAILQYDAQTFELMSTIDVGQGAFGFTMSNDKVDKNELYINNQAESTVSFVNLDTGTVDKVVEGFDQPRQGIITSPDGTKLYVTNFQGNDVRIVDIETKVIEDSIKGIPSVRQISLTDDGRYLHGASSSENAIYVIDTVTKEVFSKIPVGKEPYGAAITPDGKYVLTGEKGSSQVSVISVDNNYSVIKTITGLNEPRQAIAFDANNSERAYILNADLSVSIINFIEGTILETIRPS